MTTATDYRKKAEEYRVREMHHLLRADQMTTDQFAFSELRTANNYAALARVMDREAEKRENPSPKENAHESG